MENINSENKKKQVTMYSIHVMDTEKGDVFYYQNRIWYVVEDRYEKIGGSSRVIAVTPEDEQGRQERIIFTYAFNPEVIEVF